MIFPPEKIMDSKHKSVRQHNGEVGKTEKPTPVILLVSKDDKLVCVKTEKDT